MRELENFYTLSLKLLEHRKEYYYSEFTDESTDTYFGKSLDDIDSFLKNKYNTNYLFSSIAYSHDQRVKALPYRLNFQPASDNKTNEYIIELVTYLTQNLINEENHLSFTQVMLSEKNHQNPIKILLYEGKNSEESEEYKPIDIIEFDLSKPRWEKLGHIDKFKIHDFIGYQYGFPLYEKFENTFGNPFTAMVGNPPVEKKVEEFNRLVSVYLELNAVFKGTNYFYFIKPQSSHDEFSGVLILGLKKRIPIDEFTLWVHLCYRLLSEISIKKIQRLATEKEGLKYRTNINYTVHYIKTLLGGLMDYPINKLIKDYPLDKNVRMVKDSKEIIEGLSAILNLITKVEEESGIDHDDLIKSKMFSSRTSPLKIDDIFQKIEVHRKDRGDSKKVEIIKGNVADFVPLLLYENLYPTDSYYLLYFLTLIENAFEHGKPDPATNTIQLKLNYDPVEKIFTATNIAKNNSPPPHMESVKGNIKLFDALLRVLRIGSITLEKDITNKEFKTILKLNPTND